MRKYAVMLNLKARVQAEGEAGREAAEGGGEAAAGAPEEEGAGHCAGGAGPGGGQVTQQKAQKEGARGRSFSCPPLLRFREQAVPAPDLWLPPLHPSSGLL